MKAKENTPELTKTEKLAGSVEKFFSKNGKVLAIVAAVVMKICEFFSKKNAKWLENFALALSMLVAMASSVIVSL